MKSHTILGLDIGGANTKAALILCKNRVLKSVYSSIEYFPFWEKTIDQIPEMLNRILNKIIDVTSIDLNAIDLISITITAELSDAFQTKREGISIILNALKEVMDLKKMRFISNNIKFIDYNQASAYPLSIAAANWVSTALFLGNYVPQCILIDAGSTTIDIIPVKNSIPIAKGKDDISRIKSHELVYTGGLRATIPSITHHVPYKNGMVRISFEKFALISDIHRILENITEKEYINDTADNRSKSIEDCYARVARIICMDKESINQEELDAIINYIYEKQLEIIKNELKLFLNDLILNEPSFENKPLFVITGLSSKFLIKPVLKKLGYNNLANYEKITQISDNICSSAYAVAGALYYQLI